MTRCRPSSRLPLPISCLAFLLLFSTGAPLALAQDNYEIQVYSYDTVQPRHTMLELHSNFTFMGSKTVQDGLLPTEHAFHETLEITHGFTPWFETGFYIFTSARGGDGWDFVGSHIRPRFRVPESWHWPVGVSLSNEIGYQRRQFSPDTWTWEIRPIVDKQLGRWYLSFNPTFDRSFHGESASRGFEFSPNFKIGFDFTKKISAGLEYYGALGPVAGFDPVRDQEHQVFPVVDLNVSPKWEINFGVGVGVTRSTDHLIAKMILGYRFDF
ncbi:MAG TPA: transporter [Methylomirabilota bacterium]|nr:transporter [Methylomirabilota bacterium]